MDPDSKLFPGSLIICSGSRNNDGADKYKFYLQFLAVFRIRMDPGFFADPDLKVWIQMHPLINLWDLKDGLNKVLEEPD